MKIRKHADVPVSGQPKNACPDIWITYIHEILVPVNKLRLVLKNINFLANLTILN